MKIGTIVGICALACATALGCSGTDTSGGGGDLGNQSGSDTSSGSSNSGSSGASASGSSSSGSSHSGSSSSGSSNSGSSSGSSGSGSGSTTPADGGIVSGDAAAGDNAETDYSQTKTITMTDFQVAAHGEVYYCQNFANPWGKQVDIKTYSLDMSTGSHHMFAFYLNNASNGGVAPCPAGGLTFGAFTFTSQSPQQTQTYPDTVGATLPATTGFQMMVHYLNTGSSPITAHIALTMNIAKPNVVTQHAGVIFLNNAGISAPPGMSTATSSYTLPQNVTILSSDSHMHQGATNFVATAGSQTLFTTTEWAEPPAKVYSPPLQLPVGTNITWSCTYNNTTGTTLKFGESAQTSVMCISVSIFYPVADVTNPELGSPISGILGGPGH
jgi:hypothetical protein